MKLSDSRLPCMLIATSLSLPAQWTEVGDAGQLPNAAQVPLNTIVPLTTIAGNLPAGDVDMYLIEIADPAAFSASTVGGATFDTALYLFDQQGRGVSFGEDAAFTVQSEITATFVGFPGCYYLAVSSWDVDPTASNDFIWNDTPFNVERQPDGPRRFEPVDGWSGSSNGNGTYTVTLTGTTYPATQVVLPDNHHLTESDAQTGSIGSTSWWRTGGGRFQVLYEASHFASAGVTGGVFLDKMMFRGEDGEPNRGGQSWAGVTVQFGTTSQTAATLTNDFAVNQAAATMSASVPFSAVTVTRSVGSTPNNYNICLDLYNSPIVGYFYDPNAGNLLIDVTLPTAAVVPATVGSVMAMQDTTGGMTVVHGAGVNTGTPAAATGTLSTSPPVIGFKVCGPGGSSPPIPARNEYYGAACGADPSTFYEGFLPGQPFDLIGLTLTPTGNRYSVSNTAPAFDPTKVNASPNSTSDDGSVAFALGFTFNYPGGSTTDIRPTTNGYVWLNGTSTSVDFSPTVEELLGIPANLPARLLPCWYDFHAGRNTVTNPNSGLHVLTDTSGGAGNAVCYVTWFNVGVFNSTSGTGVAGHAVHDLQMAIFEATGVVEFRYGSMPTYGANALGSDPGFPAIVGFTRGRIGGTPSIDPQSRDLSVESPFETGDEATPWQNMGQRAVATPVGGGIAYNGRMFPGQTLTWDVVNVPSFVLIGAQLLDGAASRPGLMIPGITVPGCMLSVTPNAFVIELTVNPGPAVTGSVALPIMPGNQGFEIYAQYVILDGLFVGGPLINFASNAIKHRIGLN